MIIVEVCGGLGNQMFQYALYTKLKIQGKEVKLDLTSFDQRHAFRKYELDIFKVDYETACKSEIRKYKKTGLLRRWLKRSSDENIYVENLDIGYQPVIFDYRDKYLQGYWQCEKYFEDIRNILLKKYTFPVIGQGKCRKILEQIQNIESVSLHVRRGDYLNENNWKAYGNICTLDYYQRAVAYVRKKVPAAVFFLFTNDIAWVKENIYEDGMIIVDCNLESQDYQDMYLMSQCKHNIIANSSFSWWGAWLNQNTDKIVIAPSRWFNNHETTDTICQDWIHMNNKGIEHENFGKN
ncbi:MAG: alpha-1,2-fucosyltransferase [Lachnospiraceae bacterium]|nr:alpha-1,2-fucosyltransferase [Lachnospiraceae bacterium]